MFYLKNLVKNMVYWKYTEWIIRCLEIRELKKNLMQIQVYSFTLLPQLHNFATESRPLLGCEWPVIQDGAR